MVEIMKRDRTHIADLLYAWWWFSGERIDDNGNLILEFDGTVDVSCSLEVKIIKPEE